MVKKILWISLKAPYDKVDHAGGKVHNFYLKKMHESTKFDIKLFSYSSKEELKKIDLDDYHIDNHIELYDYYPKCDILRKLLNIESRLNIFNRNFNMISNFRIYKLKKFLKKLYRDNYMPDIVILEWTQIIFQIKHIKKYFPNAKYICIEEDVSYLSYKRRIDFCTGLNKQKAIFRYNGIKKKELECLKLSDLIIINNRKDLELLKNDGINQNKCFISIPYFDKFEISNSGCSYKKIMFYGAMSRPENYESIIWFINNVFNFLDRDYYLYIVGSNPPKELLQYKSDRIIITGFVKTPVEYFKQCGIFVAPLLLGAGIKIKILEAMYAKKIVLTNQIGIEGIPAKNGVEYIYCSNDSDYMNYIKEIQENKNLQNIGNNAYTFINNYFNMDSNIKEMINVIDTL